MNSSYFSNPWARYLIRSTQFYDVIKQNVAFGFFESKNMETLNTDIKKYFHYEMQKFPELIPCINEEVEQLVKGNTPYWSLNLNTGDLSPGFKESPRLKLKEKPCNWLFNHINTFNSIGVEKHVKDIEDSVERAIKDIKL